MARKQQPQFGQDVAASPDSVPMSTNAIQRELPNAEQGKVKRDILRQPIGNQNPFRGEDSWGTEHSGLLGF